MSFSYEPPSSSGAKLTKELKEERSFSANYNATEGYFHLMRLFFDLFVCFTESYRKYRELKESVSKVEKERCKQVLCHKLQVIMKTSVYM